MEGAFCICLLPVDLLDGPAPDLQALCQFPLAHSLGPLLPDVPPLLFGQDRPPAGVTALGPRLGLARDGALPDRVPPPFAEGDHHLELELQVGRGRVEVLRQGTELHTRMVQALDHLQPVAQAPGEPVDDAGEELQFGTVRRALSPVARRRGVGQHLAHRVPVQTEHPGGFPDAHPLHHHRPANP